MVNRIGLPLQSAGLKIAIVGTGIAGNVAAYLLAQHHDITVFEKNDYVGGHSNTVEVDARGEAVAVDTGFHRLQ